MSPLYHEPVSPKLPDVIRALRLLLLFGALTGLFGQAIAFASVPQAAPRMSGARSMAMAGMSEDCMKMMERQRPGKKPCKGMTLACIAAMGCAVPMLPRDDDTAIASRRADAVPAFWPAAAVLYGSELPPEPEPPTLLG